MDLGLSNPLPWSSGEMLGSGRKYPQHGCLWAEPCNALLAEPPRGSYRLTKLWDPLGFPASPSSSRDQPSPAPLLCFGASTTAHALQRPELPPFPHELFGDAFVGCAHPRLPPSTLSGHIPWLSSLCCRYCSSSPRGQAAPCTPPRRGTAPSGTTTSVARWRLGGGGCQRPGGHRGWQALQHSPRLQPPC